MKIGIMFHIIVAMAVGMGAFSASARGALVTVWLEGNVSGVSNTEGTFLEGKVVIGDVITGTYIYDTDTPNSSTWPSTGRYEHWASPAGFSLSVGGLDLMTDLANTDFVVQIANNYPYSDIYSVSSTRNLPLPDGTEVASISWGVRDDSATAISSVELPGVPPVLTDWAINNINIRGRGMRTGFGIQGYVTSIGVIPEPATVVLLGFGGLLLLRKRD